MNDLVTKLREDNEMLRDGYQENLTRTWHDHAMQNAAQDCLEAADRIEALEKLAQDMGHVLKVFAEQASKSNPNTPERNDK